MARQGDPQQILDFERVLADLAQRATENLIDPTLDRIAALLIASYIGCFPLKARPANCKLSRTGAFE